MASDYQVIIGLEVHVQLRTRTKMFCGCRTTFGDPPNTNVCPTCLGLPGALPLPNAEAIRLATRGAIALGCTVHPTSVFARKNYFYPDLPKGYQISQFDEPIAFEGSVDVELSDGTIVTVSRDLPAGLDRYRRVPLVRGVLALGESVGLGTKAMAWAARTREPEEGGNGYSSVGVALSTLVAVLLALGLFGLAPGAVAKAAGIEGRFAFGLTEGAIRIGVLLAYLWALSRTAAVRRVFAYHGAEHKTISCYEAGDRLIPARAEGYSRLHPRCGTSFLLIVMIVAIFVFAPIGLPDWYVLVATRVLGVPLIAGLSFEVIKWAGRNRGKGWVQTIMWPGMQLQRLTTREPDLDQLAVACAAMEAVLAVEDPRAASAEEKIGMEVVA